MIKVFLDLGHGGKDGGAQGNGLSEKELNFTIGEKVKKLLQENYEGVEIKSSRQADETKSLAERTKEANLWKADVLLSIHINSATDKRATGFESFIYNGSVSQKTQAFQNVLHGAIMNNIKGYNVIDRGKKKANFHMLRESSMTACLTENLFIVNPIDAGLLKQEQFLDKLALGHVLGLEQFLGLKKKAIDPEPKPEEKTDTLYKVQIGAFSNLENAKALSDKAKKDGYETFIIAENK